MLSNVLDMPSPLKGGARTSWRHTLRARNEKQYGPAMADFEDFAFHDVAKSKLEAKAYAWGRPIEDIEHSVFMQEINQYGQQVAPLDDSFYTIQWRNRKAAEALTETKKATPVKKQQVKQVKQKPALPVQPKPLPNVVNPFFPSFLPTVRRYPQKISSFGVDITVSDGFHLKPRVGQVIGLVQALRQVKKSQHVITLIVNDVMKKIA